MKKKLISIFLAAAMTMSLTACAQETTGGDSTTTTAAGGDEGTTTTAAPQGVLFEIRTPPHISKFASLLEMLSHTSIYEICLPSLTL